MKIARVVAATLLLAGAAACSHNDDNPALVVPTASAPGTTAAPSSTPTATGPTEIHAARFNTFTPSTVIIKEGQSVKVVDTDPYAPHNFVVNGVGRSRTLNEGDTFTLHFAKAGTYRFVCTFHESKGMVGTITVTAS